MKIETNPHNMLDVVFPGIPDLYFFVRVLEEGTLLNSNVLYYRGIVGSTSIWTPETIRRKNATTNG